MTTLNMTTTHRLVTAGFSVLIAGFLAVALPTGASAQSAGSPFSGFFQEPRQADQFRG